MLYDLRFLNIFRCSILRVHTLYIAGANGVEVPPVPIPKTEVKLNSGENTWRATAWEDSTVPALIFLLSSVGRARGCQPRCRWFKSNRGSQKKKRPVFWAFFSFLSRFLAENGLFLCQMGEFD